MVSEATLADPAWKQVVAALEAKRAARRPFVVSWKVSPDETLPALAERFPRHACFAARPEEAGRDFVARVHRLTRRLDGDPYADTELKRNRMARKRAAAGGHRHLRARATAPRRTGRAGGSRVPRAAGGASTRYATFAYLLDSLLRSPVL